METVPPLMTEEEDEPKENVPPPQTWEVTKVRRHRRNCRHTFYCFSVGLCGNRQGWQCGVKHEPSLGSVPGPYLRSLVSIISFYLRHRGSGSASVSPLVDILFETMCLVIIFSLCWYDDPSFCLKFSAEQSNSTSFILYQWLTNYNKKIKSWIITKSILPKDNKHLAIY